MLIFQKSIINKYLKSLDEDKVDLAYEEFQKFYGNKARLANMMQLKEENYQEGFLWEIFVQTLGYTINPDENYNLTDKLYKDYKTFKDRIFETLVSGNPQYDNLTLFKKSQKLLDRFLFILFAEDSGLIPPNAISKIIDQWKNLIDNDEYFPLYNRFQKLFRHLDKGHIYKIWGEIPAYNGGLFREDEILDSPELKIPDGLLQNHTSVLSAYDFGSEVDVNILGHIFEHSLGEIEIITAELQGEKIDKTKSKRKKDGIFYTPKYFTKFIVENTLGKLCNEKKEELQIKNILINDIYRLKSGKLSQKGKQLYETLHKYKEWLLTLKILDPACGNGAFLNQTLDFLIAEHKQTDDLIAELTGDLMQMFDTDKSILENNIYGVDINEESVEIAKLSLWLRTAQRGRTLSDLSGNIKCGNSLVDDAKVAGEKAFDWNIEFKEIMDNGGFDVVLGNPPYMRVQQLDYKTIDYLKNYYKTALKRIDIKKAKSKTKSDTTRRVEEYFDKYKTDINDIQNHINHTDKEIDKMVYELYELTAEEIEIVENSIK